MSTAALLDVTDVTVDYAVPGRARVRALDRVSIRIGVGETLGLVGESGSGKSTLGRAILGLTPVASGAIEFNGRDLAAASRRERRGLSADLQVVFQDPFGSLNPARTVGHTLGETYRAARPQSGRVETAARIASMLAKVGLPADAGGRYPRSFSGGQRQRIAIARALMGRPQLVICDEPASALDLSVQAQVLNLLKELQRETGLSYLFISHDIAVVRSVAHRIAVLYRGRMLEQGVSEAVYSRPAHPYTRALLEAVPVPDPELQRLRRQHIRAAAKELLPPVTSSDACVFASRCEHAVEICRARRPQFEQTPDGVSVACHRWRELRGNEPGSISPKPPEGSRSER